MGTFYKWVEKMYLETYETYRTVSDKKLKNHM